MTENLFICRGISKDTNEFVYGYYVKIENKHYLIDKDTLMQNNDYMINYISHLFFKEITQEPDRWVGLHCINGNMIFENDILGFYSQSRIGSLMGKKLEYRKNLIFWNKQELSWDIGKDGFFSKPDFETDEKKFEVLGNKHFNKELLENINNK
jgi:hypothetical protein